MKRQEKIEKTLRSYFGESLIELNVVTLGIITDIEATYKDFRPVRDVRRWIDDNIPDVNNITLYRTYSDGYILDALRKVYNDSSDVQCMVDAELFSVSFYESDSDNDEIEKE